MTRTQAVVNFLHETMYQELATTLLKILSFESISVDRRSVLQPLIDFIALKLEQNSPINLNFICTHNSRRSHLSQIWAQVAAFYYKTENVYCYSGGTEETELFPKIAETLNNQGFNVFQISEGKNPVYAIKYAENEQPIIGFSKKYDHIFNTSSQFCAIMTCSHADGGCPFIAGAEKRIPITYEDPKIADGTPFQDEMYTARSIQIANEMFYVFSQLKK